MQSHEVMREAVAAVGAKAVAAEMSVSSSLIYKWCEASKDEGAAGADNPLDRIAKIYDLTGNVEPIAWLCQQADGFFVKNPTRKGDSKSPVVLATRKLLKEFSELLQAVSRSIEDDGEVDEAEAARIRKEWEDLKRTGETFVVACEEGRSIG
ncbi:MAG: hypothetical protein O3A51_09195 [Verrucomicrobia bacterium]|nr:hypothetical protein [Verrucomicrobiota bacterium]